MPQNMQLYMMLSTKEAIICLTTSQCISSILVSGDLIGKLLAYSSATPIYIVVAFVTLIFFKRDVHTVWKALKINS